MSNNRGSPGRSPRTPKSPGTPNRPPLRIPLEPKQVPPVGLDSKRPHPVDTFKPISPKASDPNLRGSARGSNNASTPRSPDSPTSARATPFCLSPKIAVRRPFSKDVEIQIIQEPHTIEDWYGFQKAIGAGGYGTVLEVLHAKTFKPFAGKITGKKRIGDQFEGTLSKNVFQKIDVFAYFFVMCRSFS